MNPFKRLLKPGVLLLGIIIIGVLGYTLVEGWSPLEALYMLVISVLRCQFLITSLPIIQIAAWASSNAIFQNSQSAIMIFLTIAEGIISAYRLLRPFCF